MTAARYRTGEFDIAVVSDGYIHLDAGAVFGLVPRTLWEPVVGSENIDEQHRIQLALNCMLVRRGDDVLLIETGMGAKYMKWQQKRWQGEYGTLLDELAAIGVAPEDVTHVVNTHLHADHCGWNTVSEKGVLRPTFPNARYFIQEGEYATAMRPNDRTRGTYLPPNFEPLELAGQLELVDGEREILRGVTFLPTPGHTADHASVVLSSGGETAIYTGDLVHHAVQMERAAWIAAFDVLPLVSLQTKKEMVEYALQERALLICVHNPFPGVGRLTEVDGRRHFVEE